MTSNTDNTVVIDPRFDVLRDTIRANGAEHAQGSMVVDGVSAAKVRAFSAIMVAAKAGFVFEGQATTLALDWAAACGQPLADSSVKSAASKLGVWIKAGRSNTSGGVVEAMTDLARGNRDKSTRFFEKCCTGMRRSLKEGRPLSTAEMDAILIGEKDEEQDVLAELVATLKRIVTSYGQACELFPSDQNYKSLHADAIGRHGKAKADLDLRDAQRKVVGTGVKLDVPATPEVKIPDAPEVTVQSNPPTSAARLNADDEALLAAVAGEMSAPKPTNTALGAAMAAAFGAVDGSDPSHGLFVTG